MKKTIFALLAAGAVCISCAKELHENAAELTPQQQTLMTKLVGGTQGELIPGSLSFKDRVSQAHSRVWRSC